MENEVPQQRKRKTWSQDSSVKITADATVEKKKKKIRPLMRGWSHAVAAVVALIVSIFMGYYTYGHDDFGKFISVVIFGITLVNLYATSAIYHISSPYVTRPTRKLMQIIDHANIFMMIAGTYTPLCYTVVHDPLRWIMLATIWVLGIVGVLITIYGVKLNLPRALQALLYVAMGWVGLTLLPSLYATLQTRALTFMVASGILYSLGALIYATRTPNLFPKVFGFHEVFHVFVIFGGSGFGLVIWEEVVLKQA